MYIAKRAEEDQYEWLLLFTYKINILKKTNSPLSLFYYKFIIQIPICRFLPII